MPCFALENTSKLLCIGSKLNSKQRINMQVWIKLTDGTIFQFKKLTKSNFTRKGPGLNRSGIYQNSSSLQFPSIIVTSMHLDIVKFQDTVRGFCVKYPAATPCLKLSQEASLKTSSIKKIDK